MNLNALLLFYLRTALMAAATIATTSWACSLAQQPSDLQSLPQDAGVDLRQPGAGADDDPPSRPVVSNFKVTLIENGCNGSGISCPENDLLSMNVNSTDNITATANLRYVAAFAESASAATRAVVKGHPCRDSNGCSAINAPGAGMAFLLALYLLWQGNRAPIRKSLTKQGPE